jgi:hypothetical protein
MKNWEISECKMSYFQQCAIFTSCMKVEGYSLLAALPIDGSTAIIRKSIQCVHFSRLSPMERVNQIQMQEHKAGPPQILNAGYRFCV